MMKKNSSKKTLGKGLSAIFGEELNDEKTQAVISGNKEKILKGNVLEIEIDKVVANKKQPRVFFEKEKLHELADSILSVGIIEPLIVSQFTETANNTHHVKYEIIAGERRWRAARVAGLQKIPCIVKGNVGENLLEIMLIENIQREDLTPIEEARSYEEILNRKKITQEKLAKILGKTRTYITNTVRLLKLPAEVIELVNQKTLSVGHAKVLIGLPKSDIMKLVKKIQEENLSVRVLEEILREHYQFEKKNKTKKANKNILPPTPKTDVFFLEEFATKIQDHLKTKIKILPINKKVGKIEIEYYNYEHLEELKKILVAE